MTCGRGVRRTKRIIGASPTVGLFGLMGQGNLGNDGSMEALLSYLGAQHPEATLDALCTGPDLIGAQYDLPAADLHWHPPERQGNLAWSRSLEGRRARDWGWRSIPFALSAGFVVTTQ